MNGAGGGGKFCHDEKDRCWFHTEGICGGNSCFFDPHCEPIFANMYDYVGKGFVEGMNGAAAVYSRFTKLIFYLLPAATHYDERLRIANEDIIDNKTFVLMLEYFDANRTQTPTDCYALYDNKYEKMNVFLSDHPYDGGEYKAGSYDSDSFNVMFKAKFVPPTQCEPYSFICKTSEENFVRLPESPDYYFGTEWIDWKWSNYSRYQSLQCKENHYFKQNAQWLVNGGPTLQREDIWYYHEGNTCIGCDAIPALECWQDCILSDFAQGACDCDGTYTRHPTDATTSRPTDVPTHTTIAPTRRPSEDPTGRPSSAPVQPTDYPTRSPLPVGETHSPSEIPSGYPSIDPTVDPTVTVISPTVDGYDPVVTAPAPWGDERKATSVSVSGGMIVIIVASLLVLMICVGLFAYKMKKRERNVTE